MKYLIVIAVALFGAVAVNAFGAEFNRTCRTAEMSQRVKTGFQVPAYLGTWYETKRYEAVNQNSFDCVIARYTTNADGSVQVDNSGYAPGGQFIQFIGRATVAFPDQSPLPAKLLVTFFPGQPAAIYWVMSTDYINHAVVWSCSELPGGRSREQVWVLSRTPVLNAAGVTQVRLTLGANDLPLINFRETSQNFEQCRSPIPF